MKDYTLRYLAFAFMWTGIVLVITRDISIGGLALASYGLGSIIKDKQYIGKYFPNKEEVQEASN